MGGLRDPAVNPKLSVLGELTEVWLRLFIDRTWVFCRIYRVWVLGFKVKSQGVLGVGFKGLGYGVEDLGLYSGIDFMIIGEVNAKMH